MLQDTKDYNCERTTFWQQFREDLYMGEVLYSAYFCTKGVIKDVCVCAPLQSTSTYDMTCGSNGLIFRTEDIALAGISPV